MRGQYAKTTLRLMRYIYNQMERIINAEFENLGTTLAQASVLLYLFENRKKKITQQNIQSALLLSHPTITGLMKRLEAKGFIARMNNPEDCRCKFVSLTEKGFMIERSLKENIKSMEARSLNGLEPEELNTMSKCLCAMAENLSLEESKIESRRHLKRLRGKIFPH